MQVILYMATTINGLIAKLSGKTNFVSVKEWKNFYTATKNVGNIIIGRKTYEIMIKNKEFARLPKLTVIIVSRRSIKPRLKNHFIAASPAAAIKLLHQQGFKRALIAGGGQLNAAFMKADLINEIYLDIEPIALGQGIPLFTESKFETKLKLIGIKKFSAHELQLHYKVI